jgi:hypothetical protein
MKFITDDELADGPEFRRFIETTSRNSADIVILIKDQGIITKTPFMQLVSVMSLINLTILERTMERGYCYDEKRATAIAMSLETVLRASDFDMPDEINRDTLRDLINKSMAVAAEADPEEMEILEKSFITACLIAVHICYEFMVQPTDMMPHFIPEKMMKLADDFNRLGAELIEAQLKGVDLG